MRLVRGCHKKTLGLLGDADLGCRVEAVLGCGSKRLDELYASVALGLVPPYEAAAVLYEVLGSLKYGMSLLNELGRRGKAFQASAQGMEKTLASASENLGS